MIHLPSTADLGELCGRLVVLAMLLLGAPMSSTTLPASEFDDLASSSLRFDDATFSTSPSTGVHADGPRAMAALLRARTEIERARTILVRINSRDVAGDEYVATLEQILAWADRPGADLRADVATLATSLEAARLRFSERTTSLDQWLALNSSAAEVTAIPPRFVVMSEPEPLELPDYEVRRLARELLG